MSSSTALKITTFSPAIVRDSKSNGIHVEYSVYDPIADTMIRKRVKFARLLKACKSKREKLIFAQKIADELNKKLSGGWSPLTQTDDGRLYTPIAELKEVFLKSKKREGCRDTTITNYTSFTNLFLTWCEDNGLARKFSGTFLRRDAVEYMDYIASKENGNRSYNNTLKALRSFWSWAVEHCYAKENPFVGIKLLPKTKKHRGLIDADTRKKILAFFDSTNPQMSIVCMLVYHSAIRPIEAHLIQMKDIDIERRRILIPAENAKNGKVRSATLSRQLISRLEPIVRKHEDSPMMYLFGKGNMEPNESPIAKSYFGKLWVRMRDALGLPDTMQLYSLRDSGLTDLIHAGVDPLTVQHHADHSSLEIQNLYTDHYDPDLNNKIYENVPDF